MTQAPGRRPFAESHFSDMNGSYEVRGHRLGDVRGWNERTLLSFRVAEKPHQMRSVLVGESCAHFSDVAQSPWDRDSQQKRTDTPGAIPASFRPAADHDILGPLVLHLDPGVATFSLEVWGVASLGHHPFEARLPRCLQDIRASGITKRVGRGERVAGEVERLELLSALVVGKIDLRAAVQMQKVEGDIGAREFHRSSPNGANA